MLGAGLLTIQYTIAIPIRIQKAIAIPIAIFKKYYQYHYQYI